MRPGPAQNGEELHLGDSESCERAEELIKRT